MVVVAAVAPSEVMVAEVAAVVISGAVVVEAAGETTWEKGSIRAASGKRRCTAPEKDISE